MWESIVELCAGMFGVTARSRSAQLGLFCVALFVIGLLLFVEWGPPGLGLPAAIFGLAVAAARFVAEAREAVWRAACLPIDAPGQQPDDVRGLALAPTQATLMRLAGAVDHARRGRGLSASELLPEIRAELLREEEVHLLEAVRAMISMWLGAGERAAAQAEAALPTGSEEIDLTLGRALMTAAWNDPARLAAIGSAWDRAGVRRGPLRRMATLARVRIDTSALHEIGASEARDLADEARALGDEDLAAELDAHARPAAYR